VIVAPSEAEEYAAYKSAEVEPDGQFQVRPAPEQAASAGLARLPQIKTINKIIINEYVPIERERKLESSATTSLESESTLLFSGFRFMTKSLLRSILDRCRIRGGL
jgi:hypothetical protein